jgi:hypothetical protein
LENRRKTVTKSLRSALKRKNKIEEGGASRSGVRKKKEITKARAQKMMRRRGAPSTMLTLV